MRKFYSLLGLAKKAGKVAAGEDIAESTVRQKNAFLLILATDASANTKKKFHNAAAHHEVPIIEVGLKTELGRAIGVEFRAILAITEPGFAKKLLEIFENFSCEV